MASRGPGSYTGLRVGLMSAKALAYATGCRLVPVDTFAAVAEQAPGEARKLLVVADALQGLAYVQRFERGGSDDVWQPADELAIRPADEWLPWLAAGVWVGGPGVSVFADRIPAAVSIVAEEDRLPRVESVFAAGLRIPPVSRDELMRLEPLYLRGSSAEENWAKAGKK
jgi:tRNA threonylcarbamoyladenosine biosynthesis protein TsaB